ncbi:MAG: TIR domain-containing protein [Anaerolineales bacterium]
MANTYNFDVFLSHNSSDKPAVEHIARLLRDQYQIKVWLDSWNIIPGELVQEALERALADCRTVTVFIGPSGIGPWESVEMRAAIAKRVGNSQLRVIPVLLPGAPDSKDLNLPGFLQLASWVDFRAGLDDQDALHRLYCGITGQAPGDHAAPTVLGLPSTVQHWHFPHRYGDRPNFTGRVAERKLLTDWLNADGQPLFILRALGGFGKSALSWYWLNNDVDKNKWQRVSWWSFYEGDASFEHFLGDTLEYLGVKDANSINPRQQTARLLEQLQSADILLVLDGFERVLRAFSGMGAAYQGDGETEGDGPETEEEARGRDCVSPAADDFLRGLNDPSLRSKILMTTRLCPHVLEYQDGELQPGCCAKELTALTPDDAYTFFTEKEKITATRAEVEAACAPYDYHPLSLNLLAGLIKKDFQYPRDMRAAGKYKIIGDIKNHKDHILKAAYETLPAERQQLLSQIACLRGSVDYDTIKTIFSPAHLDQALNDLQDRGLLQVTTLSSSNHLLSAFDLHPIVRRYAYERLTAPDKVSAHTRLADYFAAVPEPEKVEKLDDLAAVIELYHHLVRAGKFDEAMDIYYHRIVETIHFQFGAYQLDVELLNALFPDGQNNLPKLKRDGAQAFILNQLANAYSLSGQPRRAIPLFEMQIAIREKAGTKRNIAIGLGNMATQQLSIGTLAQAERNHRRSIELGHEIEDEFHEAIGHRELGRVLSTIGEWQDAEQEAHVAIDMFEKRGNSQSGGYAWAYYALYYLLMTRANPQSAICSLKSASECAKRALELANEDTKQRYPHPRDYIRAHWLLGAAYRVSNDLSQAETHLGEALRRCRAINLVEHEADILLEVAKLRHLQGETAGALRLAREALLITERSGYVLQGADVNLFLVELAESREKRAESSEWGGRETALMHARQARALATCDGGEYVYKVAYEEAGRLIGRLEGTKDEG